MDKRMGGHVTDGQMYVWVNRWIGGWVDIWMDWTDGWMDRWTNGQMDG